MPVAFPWRDVAAELGFMSGGVTGQEDRHDAGAYELPGKMVDLPVEVRTRQALAEAVYPARESSVALSAGLSWRGSSPPSPRQKTRSAARTR